MRRIRTINMLLVLFVFVVMFTSAILSSIFFILLYKFEIIYIFPVPKVLPPIIMVTVSAIIGTGLSFILSKRVLMPLRELISATKEISKGNFDVRVPLSNRRNELGDLIKSFNDMAHELASIEIFRKDFINNFSHEFKTPIVSIRGFAKQLQQDSLSKEQRKEYADIIYKESERLAKISSSVLHLTKLENQKIVTEKKSFSLDEQIRNCILLLQKDWDEKNINLHIELQEIMYYNNEEMLSQVWLNLIGNAIKFTPASGNISIQCYKTGTEIRVKIQDDGIGMTDETCLHIFEKFYQGDYSHTSEGNGLGLSIVKRIIELCGGTISVKSQLQKGSTFLVRLPPT